jgi:osmotically inducible protein OsmC
MAKRTADAVWTGDLPAGAGEITLGSGAFKGPYTYKSRFEEGAGTNPEELLGAAHAACFTMALTYALSQAGHAPVRVRTQARVTFGPVAGGFAISRIDLETEGEVPGVDAATFQTIAAEAKAGCPVSKALAAVPVELKATLVRGGAAGRSSVAGGK